MLILIILEEALPLVALYAPFLLPSTCVLPSQQERIEEKAENDKSAAIADVRAWLQHAANVPLDPTPTTLDTQLSRSVCK
jgi:LETM1 and EF-hand domain-containing protein 1, mitochondrial